MDSSSIQKLPNDADFKGTYCFVSLGCPKNTVDSERMMGLLKLDGYRLVDNPDGSDFVIVNTCGFIEQARQESFAAIDEMLLLKQRGRTGGVIVTGCLAERQKEQLLADRPEIDSLVGVFGREQITQIADRLRGDQVEQRLVFQPASIRTLPDTDRLRITPRHFAYLKISEGCDRLCTFCAIPLMRGQHVSKPMEEVIREAQQLADDGVRELMIVAQDTTYYGIDEAGHSRLNELLLQLQKVDGLRWIRLMYFYPQHIEPALVETIAGSDKILPYIDMPLQHIDDTMLRRMARRVDRAQTQRLLDWLRESIPGLALRTTLITGFPGETDQQFETLHRFIEAQRFERLGVFTYSYEPDTPAARLDGHVEEALKQSRRETLMKTQQQIAQSRNQSMIGQTLEVIIDRCLEPRRRVYLGRSYADAPEIDALVYVTAGDQALQPGQFIQCEVVACREYDLVGYAVSSPC